MSDRKIAESRAALPDAASTTRVLLVDDQAIVAEAIRRMLATEENLEYHYCADPARAIAEAVEFQPTVILLVLVCLLYTTDAADDMQCEDLGGRRIFFL